MKAGPRIPQSTCGSYLQNSPVDFIYSLPVRVRGLTQASIYLLTGESSNTPEEWGHLGVLKADPSSPAMEAGPPYPPPTDA